MPRRSLFAYDRLLLREAGCEGGTVAGADEVGRGCLAGPLVVAAVVLDYATNPARSLSGLNDSKLLSSPKREELCHRVLKSARCVSFQVFAPRTIDERGLHVCNLEALSACLERLWGAYDVGVVDGFDLPRLGARARRVVGADRCSASVAAASVVAKVMRDRLMRRMDERHPGYGFANHVGYGTRAHREAIRLNGTCALHRLSFASLGATQLELSLDD
jgi:ribonuclease HII